MSIHRYSFRGLLPDYLRGGAGLAIAVGGVLLAPGVPHVLVIFGGLTALFLLFTIRTALRQHTRVELTEDSLSLGRPWRKMLCWSQLSDVKLRYYSTRRNRTGGWMALKLAGAGQRITLDSSIDGFETIVLRSVRAALANRIDLDEVTRTNLAALGLTSAPRELAAGETAR